MTISHCNPNLKIHCNGLGSVISQLFPRRPLLSALGIYISKALSFITGGKLASQQHLKATHRDKAEINDGGSESIPVLFLQIQKYVKAFKLKRGKGPDIVILKPIVHNGVSLSLCVFLSLCLALLSLSLSLSHTHFSCFVPSLQ